MKIDNKKRRKAATERHSVQVQFTTPEDLQLFNRLFELAEGDRRPLPLYILMRLHGYYDEELLPTAASAEQKPEGEPS